MTATTRSMTQRHTVVSTELGSVTLVRDDNALRGLYFPHHWYMPDPATFGRRSEEGFADAIQQLGEYLAGERQQFNLALGPRGTPLQRRVWDLVAAVPYGATVTYGSLSARLGGAGVVSAQEVGAAVGRNPLCVFLPCHRVVGAGGKLTGYAGGVARKQFLLDLEQTARPVTTPTQDVLPLGLLQIPDARPPRT